MKVPWTAGQEGPACAAGGGDLPVIQAPPSSQTWTVSVVQPAKQDIAMQPAVKQDEACPGQQAGQEAGRACLHSRGSPS